ncbi:PREDICTED: sulfate anion transporter 1-like [Thamnophis sirtalis]|uniref:Sulfate anion transporter 1-like n=1 Tax=Thamnophis sirtalis TaxID=35019 RepID=A0A6I9YG18_9SAUR|nr:PREDICTED: sulfate anion transporter 1-like [Thamnophis sirtalis]XP_013923142.1 PREDICTED: sulfate anion transporter 1-like [Thamnophis sirtalis]
MKEEMETVMTENGSLLQFYMERKIPEKGSKIAVIKNQLRKKCSCSIKTTKKAILDFFPVLQWLPKYNCKEYIWGDVMSGLIIGIILVPQAIAYSLLAGLKPIYSLYTSFFANIIYFLMGTSRHVSVGIFSLLSLMVGQVVDRELLLAGFNLNDDPQDVGDQAHLNFTVYNLTNNECGKECYAIGVATALTFMAGVYQVLMGIFHLGFVSVYLSEPVLDGFATGASLTILTAQVKYLIGIKIPRAQGYGLLITTWANVFQNVSQANLCDVITSAICIAVLVTAKELGDKYKHKLRIPFPTELVVIVIATLVSHYGKLKEVYASSVSGEIPTGFIPPKVPSFHLMQRVAVDALPLAIVGFAFTVSLSEMFAKKYAYTVKANQEMFAIGFCNIIPAFFHCFATSAALAKTLVKTSTGCQTQVSSIVSAVVVLLVLLFFAPLFYNLQKCVLACIIIVSLRGALRKFKDIPQRYRLDKVDALVWCVTMLSSALISTEMGLLVGAIFSVFSIIGRTQCPHAALLGQIGNSVFYEDDEEYKDLLPVPKIKIFRFEAPLYYANKDFFLKCLHNRTGLNPALEVAKRKKSRRKGQHLDNKLGQKEMSPCLVPEDGDFHTIIIDCSSIPFLDTAGVSALKETFKDYRELEISIHLACCNPSVISSLEKGGYFKGTEKDMHKLLFHSISSAVQFVREREIATDDSVV